MSLHLIQKQYLLGDELSADALKLARAIYNTYLNDDKNLYLEIQRKKIESLLNIASFQDSTKYITRVLEDINEPIGVRNFKYFAKEYPLRFLVFCTYEIHKQSIEIYINEEFLHAEEVYMIEELFTNKGE